MVMPERSFSHEKYRWGFNGKETDNEVKGAENSLDFGARIYDSRLGKFLSVDPKFRKYPGVSTYGFGLNSPIRLVDDNGEGAEVANLQYNPATGWTGELIYNAFLYSDPTVDHSARDLAGMATAAFGPSTSGGDKWEYKAGKGEIFGQIDGVGTPVKITITVKVLVAVISYEDASAAIVSEQNQANNYVYIDSKVPENVVHGHNVDQTNQAIIGTTAFTRGRSDVDPRTVLLHELMHSTSGFKAKDGTWSSHNLQDINSLMSGLKFIGGTSASDIDGLGAWNELKKSPSSPIFQFVQTNNGNGTSSGYDASKIGGGVNNTFYGSENKCEMYCDDGCEE